MSLNLNNLNEENLSTEETLEKNIDATDENEINKDAMKITLLFNSYFVILF